MAITVTVSGSDKLVQNGDNLQGVITVEVSGSSLGTLSFPISVGGWATRDGSDIEAINKVCAALGEIGEALRKKANEIA